MTSPDPDDDKVEAEWKHLEEERLAAERAEAREDATETGRDAAVHRWSDWRMVVVAVALAAGVAATLLANRVRPAADPPRPADARGP